jgi:hypothetical protein
MSCSAGPQTVTDGLVLHLDAGNAKSSTLAAVEYLIVAGGGSGGAHNAGGGGAGGLLTGHIAITAQAYTITVGAGGLAVTNAVGNNGNNSSAFGLTAIGGGRGGSQSGSPVGNPQTGGSGGGGGGTQSGAAGTAGQGNAGGDGPNATGGGGGGAGSPGTAYANNKAGDGGHGIYNTILGTGYFWAGGGGGSIYGGSGYPLGSAGDGGLGGGGGGGHRAAGTGEFGLGGTGGITVGQDGTRGSTDSGGNGGSNTGSGGGGSNGVSTSGSGGSGIVVIRYPGPQRATGGTVTRVGNDTVHTFTTVGSSTFTVLPALANAAVITGVSDLSGNNNFSTAVNGPTYDSANGGSIVFDGSNDGVQIDNTSVLSVNQMTISSWNYSANYNQNGFMFEKTTNGSVNTQYSLFFNSNNTIYYRTYGLSTNDLAANNTTAGVINNQWNNIVATFDGTNKRIYVNGVLVATSGALTGTVTPNTTGPAFIGIYGNFGGYPFNGKIADTKVYNRALSAQEIQQNFEAQRGRYGI